MLVLLLVSTMLAGVCSAQQSEPDRTRATLPLTQIKLNTTFDFSSAASNEPQQTKLSGAETPSAVDAPELKTDSSGAAVPIRTTLQTNIRFPVGFLSLSDASRPQAISPPQSSDSQQLGTASLSGTVVDKSGDLLQGAQVTLAGPASSSSRTVESGSNGQFEFTGLTPGVYKLTVTAPGMS